MSRRLVTPFVTHRSALTARRALCPGMHMRVALTPVSSPMLAMSSSRGGQQAGIARFYSSSSGTRTIKLPPFPLALIGFGFACLGVGLYYHFSSDIQKYPPNVRTPLRKALYYERKDPSVALSYFEHAYREALVVENGMDHDGAPLTGILIQWGTLLDRLGRTPEARTTLILALRHLMGLEQHGTDDKKPDQAIFDIDWHTLPVLEQKKAVGLCLKLGDVHASLHRDQEAEKYYVAAVEHLLGSTNDENKQKTATRAGNDADAATGYSQDLATAEQHAQRASPDAQKDTVLFDQEHLPDWLTKYDVGVALATLGQFYAARKRYSYATHLYLRALALNGMANCQATALMNNLAESYVSMNEFIEAKQWLEKGINLADNPNTGKQNSDQAVCDETCGVLLFNLGMVFEQTQEPAKAVQMYKKAIDHGRQHEHMATVQQALQAKKRLEFQQARNETNV
ncbi:hypothetical protein BC940DRAFT_329700 [Gongronella butleri]|nr:hypothetical protein BC940DRAFT_329700 [Gongronella butleri]